MLQRLCRCHAEGAPMPRDSDQDGTPQGVFGAELRYHRERARLSQAELAALVNVSHDVISKIETGERPPAKDFPERLDAVPELDTHGALARIWGNLSKGMRNRAIPGWFRPWAELEAAATALRSYEPLLVPGLLQTEDYARAVIRAGAMNSPSEDVERRVALRMARQPALTRDKPPKIWAVLDEAALRRRVGGTELMRLQLEHLLAQAALPNVAVQVIPFTGGAHPAMGRPFVILVFPERVDTDVVYLEDLTSALYVEDVAEVDRYNVFFNHLRATALSFDDSAALVASVLKEM
jgi:transcriptional regulator with XRE-family HTH domain